jgi:ribosomal RNA-processing protein 12
LTVDEISTNMLNEIFSTLLVFLSSTNREIVKSSLGFAKLAVHTLPENLIRPQLPQLVPALLGWVHDHKNHFKTKVQHIFERMIRRFGFQEVYSCANGEEASKVLVNIKKRKDRAKRKKALAAGNSGDEVGAMSFSLELDQASTSFSQGQLKKRTTGNAFEDVLYASEIEISDSDEDEDEDRGAAITRKRSVGTFAARLRLDDDEPMDLLSGAASRFTSKHTLCPSLTTDSHENLL